MHILHTYIYNYIFISHYHIVIVAQRSFQSFFAIFNFSVALSVLQICQIWHWLLSRLESVQRTRENGHVFIPFTYQSRESQKCIDSYFSNPVFYCSLLRIFVMSSTSSFQKVCDTDGGKATLVCQHRICAPTSYSTFHFKETGLKNAPPH